MKCKGINPTCYIILILCVFNNLNLVDTNTAASKPRSSVIDIPQWGKVQGYTDELDGKTVSVYRGIPYAHPPIGKLRFKAPVLTPEPWQGVRNAVEFGTSCPQTPLVILDALNQASEMKRINYAPPLNSESCLYLNIYTPINNAVDATRYKLPVMLWIHGGAYQIGSGAEYDGGMLASKHNVIIVTINYRLGVLGFFNVPGSDDIKGNYGMLDQVGAMKWVKANIGQFGGDPNQVTIFGESAGGASVSLHLLSPLSKGLFIRAISESGPPPASQLATMVKDATDANKFSKNLGCHKTSLKCMRKKSVKDILETQTQYARARGIALMFPSIDGHFVVGDIRKMMKEKTLKSSSVPHLLGFNLDEGRIFIPLLPLPQSKYVFENIVKSHSQQYQNSDNVRDAISFEYTNWATANNNPLRWYGSASDLLGDDVFKVATVNYANYWSAAGGTAYVYKFTYRPENLRVPLWGVTHTIDLDYVFGKAYYPSNHIGGLGLIVNSTLPYTQQDKNVAEEVMKMWTRFAKTGNPGNGWPMYTQGEKEFMNIGSKMMVKRHPVDPKRMAFWDILIPNLAN